MSAAIPAAGRPLIDTATVADPFRRCRIDREQPAARGGLRNDGASNPAARAAPPISLAASANPSDVICSTPTLSIMRQGYDSYIGSAPASRASPIRAEISLRADAVGNA